MVYFQYVNEWWKTKIIDIWRHLTWNYFAYLMPLELVNVYVWHAENEIIIGRLMAVGTGGAIAPPPNILPTKTIKIEFKNSEM